MLEKIMGRTHAVRLSAVLLVVTLLGATASTPTQAANNSNMCPSPGSQLSQGMDNNPGGTTS
ncbi:MAG: hypothetical protein OEW08_12590 [Gammaproteobacteria bacterium]|nr:hypothetical protein [Gammaproteobacteria bacterium]